MVDDASGREQLLVGDPPPFDAEAFAGLAALLGERPPRALNVLQRKRLSTGLSQDELATRVGVSRQTISAIENRRRTPSVRLALTIATALNATVEELFAADELS